MKITRIAAVGLVAASLSVVGFAGCGSSSSSSSGGSDTAAATDAATTAALSKADLIAAADKVCADAHAKVKALTDAADMTDLASLQSFMTDAQAASEQALADLKALTPPDEVATEYTAYVDAEGTQLSKTAALTDTVSAATSAEEAVKAITDAAAELDPISADTKAKAAAAGLVECAKDSNGDSGSTSTDG